VDFILDSLRRNYMSISKIRKRDGRIVRFDRDKIIEAIYKAARAVGGQDRQTAERLADKVIELADYTFMDSYEITRSGRYTGSGSKK